jgi:D-serine deaminase-like pyridoxal phosphate-dependent protein
MVRRPLLEEHRDLVRAAYGAAIGRHREELITPALVLDLAAAQRNIDRMATMLRPLPAGLRPHVKAHKSPDLALRQMAAGALGISSATIWEAVVMADAGLTDIFLVNQIVDPDKIRVAVRLARQTTFRVAIDGSENAHAWSVAAADPSATIGVMVEVDTGMHRSGVTSVDAAVALAREVSTLAGLRLDGLTGYEGHCALTPDDEERRTKQRAAMDILVEVADAIVEAGVPVPILSAGGTATWGWTAAHPRINEIQAGTYVLMDSEYAAMAPEFEHALTTQATVISRAGSRVVLDAGSKSIGEGMQARIVGSSLAPARFDEEHGIFDASVGSSLRVGDKVSVVPGYAPATVNLFDAYHVVEDDRVVDIWPIIPRGPGHAGLAERAAAGS